MNPDLAIFSKRVFVNGELKPATIFIKSGKILDLTDGLAQPPDCKFIDAGNDIVMPGLIDAHVHINEPGRTEWEGFYTGTMAAAAGGITTIVDMPLNSSPVTTTPEAFELKLAAAKDKVHVNCGFWGGIVPENVNDLEPLLKSGVLGIKSFLVHSGIDEFKNTSIKNLKSALPLLAKYNLPLLVHCELELDNPAAKLLDEQPQSYSAYLKSRPKRWENEAIDALIEICWDLPTKIHIVHLSSSEALPAIRLARRTGLPISVETCPHYLYFDEENIPDGNPLYKCAPPIREMANNELLWRALENNLIDFIASDHSPAPANVKQLDSKNLKTAWGGIAGLQFSLPVIWTAAKKRGATIADMVKWLSANPATFLNLDHRKGKLETGYDADLVIWDPDAAFVLKKEMVHHRHKISPYIGENFCGLVKQTFVNGHKVFDDGQFFNLNQGEIILNK